MAWGKSSVGLPPPFIAINPDYILQYIWALFPVLSAIVLHVREDKVAQKMLGFGKPIDHDEF